MVIRLAGTDRAIVRAIEALQAVTDGPLTNAMIAEETGYSVATVKRAIVRLRLLQVLDREQVTEPGIPGYRYRYEVFSYV